MRSERPKVGIAVYIRRGDEILFGQRLSEHGQGSWCPPGGHLEYGEDFSSCARREVREECGLLVSDPKLTFVTNDIYSVQNSLDLGFNPFNDNKELRPC